MNTNSYFTIQVLKAGTVAIVINNATGEETPGTIYYWVNSVPNAARDNYTGSIVPSGTTEYIKVNDANPTVGTIIRFYRPETTALSFGDGGDNGSFIRFHGTAESKIYGNIASLIGFNENIPQACFRYMFYNSAIIDASELELPWMTLSDWCFGRMFYKNTKLIKPPVLPATTLAAYCYQWMFRECSVLPKPAKMPNCPDAKVNSFGWMYQLCPSMTSIVIDKCNSYSDGSFYGTFQGCANLTTAEILVKDGVTIPYRAFRQVFRECTSINTIKCMATSFADNAFNSWISSQPETGTFIKDKDTTWPTGSNGIPTTWTIKNANQNTQFLDFSSADRIMYNGNNHIKCIYGPNNTLLWTEEPYLTYKASGSGNIQLRIDNTGSATQATPAVIYYWLNVEPNAARDNYTGTLTAASGDAGTNRVNYVAGDIIKLWRAEQTAMGYGLNNVNYLIGGSNCIVYGNVASLVNYVQVMPDYCFERLFYYAGITDYSGLIIPWDTISTYGCDNMIYGGAQINSDSQLPFISSTTISNYGCRRMFRALSNLSSFDMTKHFCCKYAGKEAFVQMFIDCRSLESVKVKWNIEPIDSTSTYIYNAFVMNAATTNITNLDPNPTSTKYKNWITAAVGTSGLFTKATGVTWPSGTSGIPTGWTVQEI